MTRAIKGTVQKLLRRLGYQLVRWPGPLADAFAAQKRLVNVEEPVILDIGAHKGQTATTYRKLFPRAWIHSFEPSPRSFQALARSVQGDPRTTVHNTAVAEKKGTAVLNVNRSSSTSSLLSTDERAASSWGKGLLETTTQVEVQTTTVDAFCLEAGISHVDILKMDVQGTELAVLEGARSMLTAGRISLVYTELITAPSYTGQHTLHAYLSFLDSAGYDLLDVFDLVRRQGRLLSLDALFVQRDVDSAAREW